MGRAMTHRQTYRGSHRGWVCTTMHGAQVNLNESMKKSERERCAFMALTGFLVFVSLQTAWATFAFVVLVAALVFNAVTLVVIIVVMLRRTDFGRRGGRRKRCATIAALTSR